MTVVEVEAGHKITLPRHLCEELGVSVGDLLRAEVQDGKLVFAPKGVLDREAAFAEMDKIGKEAEKRWHADGLTDEDIEKMIEEEVAAVRHGDGSS